jgi:hypothetical protein
LKVKLKTKLFGEPCSSAVKRENINQNILGSLPSLGKKDFCQRQTLWLTAKSDKLLVGISSKKTCVD